MSKVIKGAEMWVVLPVGWEYNDEYYYSTGFGHPEGCFTVREMAEEFAQKKELSFFRNTASDEYFGGYFMWEERPPLATCQKFGIDEDEVYIPPAVLKSLSDEDIIEIMNDFDLKFYEVVSTKIFC